MNLCQYSDIFGRPDENLHSIRIFNIAIVDTVLTIIGAFLIYIFVNKLFNLNVSYWIYLLGLFILSIILHRLFCVRTTVDKFLFS